MPNYRNIDTNMGARFVENLAGALQSRRDILASNEKKAKIAAVYRQHANDPDALYEALSGLGYTEEAEKARATGMQSAVYKSTLDSNTANTRGKNREHAILTFGVYAKDPSPENKQTAMDAAAAAGWQLKDLTPEVAGEIYRDVHGSKEPQDLFGAIETGEGVVTYDKRTGKPGQRLGSPKPREGTIETPGEKDIKLEKAIGALNERLEVEQKSTEAYDEKTGAKITTKGLKTPEQAKAEAEGVRSIMAQLLKGNFDGTYLELEREATAIWRRQNPPAAPVDADALTQQATGVGKDVVGDVTKAAAARARPPYIPPGQGNVDQPKRKFKVVKVE